MSLECFTDNQKTILSIDFDRESTCKQICSYCYVDNMERIYPAYLEKIKRNTRKVNENAENFANTLNDEYTKRRKSKSKKYERLDKLPVRLYGSGDFIPKHLEFINKLKFKFYIISKNLTRPELQRYIPILLGNPNLTNLRLSFDAQNMCNYKNLSGYYGTDRVSLCYTGMPDEFEEQKKLGFKFDTFFNISDKKIEREKAKKFNESCPCDAGVMKLQKSCTYCNRCWRSSVTKVPSWNTMPS